MKLHTNLDYMGVAYALKKAKDDGHVTQDVCFQGSLVPHGSRTHPRAFEVQLGTEDKTSLPCGYTDQYGHKMNVRRYKNSGSCGAASEWATGCNVYAATWDEWGWFIAAVFDADPQARFDTRYLSRADFDAKTGGKFSRENYGRARTRADREAFDAVVEDMRRVQRNLEEDRRKA